MIQKKTFWLKLRSGRLRLGERTLIMGVLNLTPDSFSDGGKFFDVKSAVRPRAGDAARRRRHH